MSSQPHRRSTRSYLLACALLWVLPRPARADTPLRLALEGVLGDRVALGPPGQLRPTVLFFMGRRAKDESASFGREVDDRILNADVESVAIVDMHRYGGWLRGLATSRLRAAAQNSLAKRRERRLLLGVDARDDVVKRWHLVGDWDGSVFARFAVASDPEHPVAFVIDGRGAAHGPYRAAAEVAAALGDAARARHD